MPDATAAAQVVPILINQNDPYQGVGLILGAISTFSTILFGVLAFLTWKNVQQKEKAEKILSEIQGTYKSTVDLYSNFEGIMAKAKDLLSSSEELLKNTKENADKTLSVIDKTQKVGINAEKLSEDMKTIRENINKQLLRINNTVQSFPITGMNNSATKAYDDYVAADRNMLFPRYQSRWVIRDGLPFEIPENSGVPNERYVADTSSVPKVKREK